MGSQLSSNIPIFKATIRSEALKTMVDFNKYKEFTTYQLVVHCDSYVTMYYEHGGPEHETYRAPFENRYLYRDKIKILANTVDSFQFIFYRNRLDDFVRDLAKAKNVNFNGFAFFENGDCKIRDTFLTCRVSYENYP